MIHFWNETFLDVVLSPNPALSQSQQAVVAQDYNMTNGRVSVPVRKALLYYFQKRLRLDVAGALDGPHETPVVITNREEFAQASGGGDRMKSENFEILRGRWPELAELGGFAEAYAHADPASALVKLRLFAENLTKDIYRDLRLAKA